jgi:hypothetical protein
MKYLSDLSRKAASMREWMTSAQGFQWSGSR